MSDGNTKSKQEALCKFNEEFIETLNDLKLKKKKLMKKLNKENTYLNKNLYVEETLSQQNVIVPNWTPFQAINFFASRSLSADIEPVEQEEGSEQKGTYDAHRRPMNSILKVPTP